MWIVVDFMLWSNVDCDLMWTVVEYGLWSNVDCGRM